MSTPTVIDDYTYYEDLQPPENFSMVSKGTSHVCVAAVAFDLAVIAMSMTRSATDRRLPVFLPQETAFRLSQAASAQECVVWFGA